MSVDACGLIDVLVDSVFDLTLLLTDSLQYSSHGFCGSSDSIGELLFESPVN